MRYSPIFLLYFFAIQTISAHGCFQSEREALLEFKAGVSDPSSRLASWRGEECCKWAGITCSNQTDHVVKLNLSTPYFYGYVNGISHNNSLIGKLSQSLIALSDLKHLDLSNNNFTENTFPLFISSFRNLKYLNLQNTGLSGNIPSQLSNLSKLYHLDLSYNDLSGMIPYQLSSLSKLYHLDLSYNNLSGMIPSQLSNLSRLQYLSLGTIYSTDGYITKNISIYFTGNTFPSFISSFRNLKYLNLQNTGLSGNIPAQFSNLSKLYHLDLSYNNLSGMIPSQLSNLSKLHHLDLSGNDLSGMIPPQLSNLSRLQYLGLRYTNHAFISNIWWLSHLTSLKYLDLSGVDLQDSREWVQALNALPSLEVLYLHENNLTIIPPSLSVVNFSSLTTLELTYNNFNTLIPDWIGKITSLKELSLEYCSFFGPFPKIFHNMNSLNSLVLRDLLEGPIPPLHNLHNLTEFWLEDININEDISELVSKLSNETLEKLMLLGLINTSLTGNLTGWLNKMRSLEILMLYNNKLNGTIPAEIGNLTNLYDLELSENSFVGEISETHLAGLSKLNWLSLSSNSITITIDSNWVPSFQLNYLEVSGCKLGPKFPLWLQNQTKLSNIYMSYTGIIDNLPDWFWNLPSVSSIDLSYNQIKGKLPLYLQNFTQLQEISLKHNQFSGPIVSSLPYLLNKLDLSYNSFSGPLPQKLEIPYLSILILSNNILNGSIGQSICGLTSLRILSLSGNNISGNLPHCWSQALEIVDIANNKLSGTIPSSMSLLNMLSVLQLNNNSLTGELPSGLKFCKQLIVIDLGENQFYGHIGEWLGETLHNLTVLRLRSNSFSGIIPSQLAHLGNLQVLDLSYNNISGLIPKNLDTLMAMALPDHDAMSKSALSDFLSNNNPDYYNCRIFVSTKDSQLEYSTNIIFLKSIDISRNNLMGEIPQSITALLGLRNLNLSYNNLNGTIPKEIGNIQSLESLDFRMNKLSGIIPYSLANLNFLAILNLSHNNLSGEIPIGNQLQTLLDPYIYAGNPYLCGSQINKSCNTGDYSHDFTIHGGKKNLDEILSYLFMVLGFGFGFWAFFGVLTFKRNWRHYFFQIVDSIFDRIYVFVMVSLTRFRKD